MNRFSDLVEAGLARRAQTPGPTFEPQGCPWVLACIGFTGRDPTPGEVSAFYHRAPLGVEFGSAGEHAVRTMITHGVTWKQFLSVLKANGL